MGNTAAEGRRDAYPSRLGGEARLLPRLDPVVHAKSGAAPPGPLPAEQLRCFERDGFLAFDELIPEREISALRFEVDALLAALGDADAPEVVREPGSGEVRSVFAVHCRPGAFQRLACEPRLVRAAEQILGGSVYVHQSRVNLKPGFEGREFYWHSDFETWHVEDGMPRMRAVSVSVNLTENTECNGPLMLIPGSHRHYVACPGRTPPDHHRHSLRRQEYGTPPRELLAWLVERGGIVSAKGGPGSAVLFDCNTMHGSAGNITPLPRTNVFLVFNSVENRLVGPFGGVPPRPGFLAERQPGRIAAAGAS